MPNYPKHFFIYLKVEYIIFCFENFMIQSTNNYLGIKKHHFQPTWVGLVVLAKDLEVCSSQGLEFDSPSANFSGLVHTKLWSDFKRDLHMWTMELDPSN